MYPRGGATMSEPWTPNVPDAPPQEFEYLPVVVLDDREHANRDPANLCSTYERAVELGALMARNVDHGARFVVLRRAVGPWEEWRRERSTA
jgi:hypothetical protein